MNVWQLWQPNMVSITVGLSCTWNLWYFSNLNVHFLTMHHPNSGVLSRFSVKKNRYTNKIHWAHWDLLAIHLFQKQSRHLFLSPLFTFDANSAPHRAIFLPFPMVTSLRCSALPGGFMVVSTGPRWFSPRVLEIWNLEIHPFSVSTSLVAFLWCQITSLKLIYQLMVGRWNFLWGLTYFQGLCYFQGGYIQTCFFFSRWGMHAAIGTGALLRMALKYMQVYLQSIGARALVCLRVSR